MQEILGTSNRVLEVNLSTQTVSEFKISDKDREMYLGGKGMGLKLLSERLQPGTDPQTLPGIGGRILWKQSDLL